MGSRQVSDAGSRATRIADRGNALTANDDARVIDGEQQFVDATRAIEAFHAVDFEGTPEANAERDARIQRAMEAMPEEFTDWARPLLEGSTPPAARHRIHVFIARLGDVGLWLAGDHPELFARYVNATRNHPVHPPRSLKDVLTESDGIIWLGRSLRWLSTLYLLGELGMTNDNLETIARRNGQAMSAAVHVSEFLGPAPPPQP